MAPKFKTTQIDLSFLFGIFILTMVPMGPHFWFFIPVAISLVWQKRARAFRYFPFLAFILGIYFISMGALVVTNLDLLAYILLFLQGYVLVKVRKKRISFVSTLLWPLSIAFGTCLLMFLVEKFQMRTLSFAAWTAAQAKSAIFPHFFQPDGWSEKNLGVYETVLLPLLKISLPAWFASILGVAFFLNGSIETIFKGFTFKELRNRVSLWTEFNAWKCPDWVLGVLVAGMAMVAYDLLFAKGDHYLLRVLGWNLSILALFPIFVQGVSLTSFLMPRASFFLFIVIFVLLVWLNPIPVLVLAGLSDLWFDFRSRIRNADLD